MRNIFFLVFAALFNIILGANINASPNIKNNFELSARDILEDDNIDQYIRDILELIKSQMPNGIPDLGIPPLDPFEVPHFDIPHIDEDVIKADITIDNFIIKNLATFETKL